MNKNSDHKKVTGAFILGAALGAALGLFFSSGKGRQVWQKISKTFNPADGETASGAENMKAKDPESDRPV